MSISFQHKLRQNAHEMQDYLKDLYTWEDTIKKTSNDSLKIKITETNKSENLIQKKTANILKNTNLKRDENTIASYYNSWDKFDVVV